MIQRSIIRHSRALGSKISRPINSSSLRFYSPPLRISSFSSRPASIRRCYSTATPDTNTESTSGAEPTAKETSEDPPVEAEDPLKRELEIKNREVIDLKDKYLRSVAEFRNLQDRTKRDIAAARDFAITKFAKDLIESVDNLDRALTTVSSEKLSQEDADKDLLHLYGGLRMTENILMQTLKKHGLERFDPSEAGEKFDPNLHEATFMTKMEDKEDGSVFMTQQKGFLLNGRVVRAAKVGVVKN